MLLYGFAPNPCRDNIERYTGKNINTNPFIYSQRFFKKGEYYYLLSSNLIFLNSKSGKTYFLKKKVYLTEKDIRYKSLPPPFLDLIFNIPKEALNEITEENKCPLIKYIKKYQCRLKIECNLDKPEDNCLKILKQMNLVYYLP